MSTHPRLPLPARRLLTSDEAAAYLGVSLSTMQKHVKVAPINIGSAVRYDREALDRWIDGRRNQEPETGDHWLDKLDADQNQRP